MSRHRTCSSRIVTEEFDIIFFCRAFLKLKYQEMGQRLFNLAKNHHSQNEFYMFLALYYSDIPFWPKIIRHTEKRRSSIRVHLLINLTDIPIYVS
jgi:hypothetical protein